MPVKLARPKSGRAGSLHRFQEPQTFLQVCECGHSSADARLLSCSDTSTEKGKALKGMKREVNDAIHGFVKAHMPDEKPMYEAWRAVVENAEVQTCLTTQLVTALCLLPSTSGCEVDLVYREVRHGAVAIMNGMPEIEASNCGLHTYHVASGTVSKLWDGFCYLQIYRKRLPGWCGSCTRTSR